MLASDGGNREDGVELLKISSVALTNFPRVLFAHSNLDSTHRARIDPSS